MTKQLFFIFLFSLSSVFTQNDLEVKAAEEFQDFSYFYSEKYYAQKDRESQFKEKAEEISNALMVQIELKDAKKEDLKAYRDALLGALTDDNNWINETDIKSACSIAKTFMLNKNLQEEASLALINLAIALVEKGQCFNEAFMLCKSGLENEYTFNQSLFLADLLIVNNFRVNDFILIARQNFTEENWISESKALHLYGTASLYDEYFDEALNVIKKVKNNPKRRGSSSLFLTLCPLLRKRNPEVCEVASSFISTDPYIFAAQGEFLEQCLEYAWQNVKLGKDLYPLSTLVFLVLRNYKPVEVKALAQYILNQNDINVCSMYNFTENFDQVMVAEICCNQDAKEWFKISHTTIEKILDYNAEGVDKKAWFKEWLSFVAGSSTNSKTTISSLINTIRLACIKNGIDINMAMNLFACFEIQ